MAPVKPIVPAAADAEDAKDQQRPAAEPITIETPGLPELPPLTVEQAEELWEELSHILAR